MADKQNPQQKDKNQQNREGFKADQQTGNNPGQSGKTGSAGGTSFEGTGRGSTGQDPIGQTGSTGQSGRTGNESFEGKSKEDLAREAERAGIKNSSNMSREELIDALRNR